MIYLQEGSIVSTVHRTSFLKGVAEDVAFVFQMDILAYVSYIRLCFYLLILLHICKLRIV